MGKIYRMKLQDGTVLYPVTVAEAVSLGPESGNLATTIAEIKAELANRPGGGSGEGGAGDSGNAVDAIKNAITQGLTLESVMVEHTVYESGWYINPQTMTMHSTPQIRGGALSNIYMVNAGEKFECDANCFVFPHHVPLVEGAMLPMNDLIASVSPYEEVVYDIPVYVLSIYGAFSIYTEVKDAHVTVLTSLTGASRTMVDAKVGKHELKTINGQSLIGHGDITLPSTAGESAYQIAVNHGFEGTEEEWLESLKGSSVILGLMIGDLALLATEDKTSLVNAINEVVAKGGGGSDGPASEEVIVRMSPNDGDYSNLEGRVVSVVVDDETKEYHISRNGNVIFYIAKGKTYTIKFPVVEHYQTLEDVTYTAEELVRNIDVELVRIAEDYHDIAVGFTVELSSNPDISNTLDGEPAVVERILSRGSYVIDEQHKKYAKLNPSDHGYFADGTQYSGEYGNCFRYLPKVWIKQDDTNPKHFYVSDEEISDIALDESWIGTYKGSLVDEKLVSRPHLTTTQNRNISQFWEDAQQNGTQYGLVNYFDHIKLNVLHLAKFGKMNSEATMGAGLQDAGASYYAHTTGKTEGLGDGTGQSAYDASYGMNKLFGIEGLAGATWEFRPNIRFTSSSAVVYEGNVVSNTATGRSFPCDRNLHNSYVVHMTLGEHFDLTPKVGGGSATTYWCDGSWAATGGQVLLVGGSAYHGSLAGLACSNTTNAFANASAPIGARLAFRGNIGDYELVSGSALAALNE